MADEDDDRQGSPLRAVVGLALIVCLIVGVLLIMRQLQHAAAIQDCVASGRTNCAPIAAPPRQ
jgi:hypothetical protein